MWLGTLTDFVDVFRSLSRLLHADVHDHKDHYDAQCEDPGYAGDQGGVRKEEFPVDYHQSGDDHQECS